MVKSLFSPSANSRSFPFVKWAGGKTQLLAKLVRHMPSKFNSYIEPFVGGGALFFEVMPDKAVLSDSNEELINAYIVIKNNVEELIHDLQKHRNTNEYFYSMRQISPENLSDIERASRFIYLNKTCYNGLYRVNKKGHFNVPFGRYKNPKICDAKNLRNVSKHLKNVRICCKGYKELLAEEAKPGDFVYLDPPYHPVSMYSDFKRYTKEFFVKKDQIELAEVYHELTAKGCLLMLSNSCSKFIFDLYKGNEYRTETVYARRAINKIGSKRNPIKELLILNY